LLVGPPGCGAEEAARCFAAALVCEQRAEAETGCGECSACRRALRDRHPDVIEFEPDGQVIRVEQVAEMVDAAYLAPAEGPCKVIIVIEAERLHESAANKLLKTLEEPPGRTVFVLVAGAAEEMLETVVSRCQVVTLAALRDTDVIAALVREGVDPALAADVARIAGGRLDRAHRLAGDWSPLRSAVVHAVRRLDGYGAAVMVAAGEIAAAMDAALAALDVEHATELAALDAEIAASGLNDRAAAGLRKRLRERHTRVVRRSKTVLMAEVITAIASVYRDELVATAPAVPLDRCVAALDACRRAMEPLADRNLTVNDALLLERVLFSLPPVGSVLARA
jgi:DNA polymerase-3 subunit delta'